MTASCSRTYESCLERGTEHWHRPQRPACLPAPDRQGTRQIQTSALETTVYNVASRSARTLGSSGPPGHQSQSQSPPLSGSCNTPQTTVANCPHGYVRLVRPCTALPMGLSPRRHQSNRKTARAHMRRRHCSSSAEPLACRALFTRRGGVVWGPGRALCYAVRRRTGRDDHGQPSMPRWQKGKPARAPVARAGLGVKRKISCCAVGAHRHGILRLGPAGLKFSATDRRALRLSHPAKASEDATAEAGHRTAPHVHMPNPKNPRESRRADCLPS